MRESSGSSHAEVASAEEVKVSANRQTKWNGRRPGPAWSRWSKFLTDESGSELVEWVLIAVVLVMTLMPALMVVAEQLRDALERILEELRRVQL